MIICTNCEHDNDIGRVFCSECGAKLDLSMVNSDSVVEALKQTWIQKHWPKIAIGVAGIIVLIVGMGFWPYTVPLGDEGDYTTKRRMMSQLRIFTSAPRGSVRSSRMTEAGINSYFRLEKAKEMGVDSISVLIQPEVFSIRVVKPMFNLKLGPIKLAPTMSQSMICVAWEDRVIVRKASWGHLKVIGPAKNAMAKSVYKLLAKEKEFDPFKNIVEIKAEDSSLFVKAKK